MSALKHSFPSYVFASVVSSVLLSACGGSGSDTDTNSAANKPATETKLAATSGMQARPALPIPSPMIGVTTDSIGNVSAIVSSLKSIGKTPTTRVVFDEFVAASYYTTAVKQIRDVSYVMGELLDSYYVNQYSVQAYLDRTREYTSALGADVDIWEVGNEINGEWLGTTPDVVAKMTGAYDIVKSQGKTAELTLYYNKDCWANPSNEMFAWAQKNVPDRMKQGLDYVLVSFYEDDCNGIKPDWPQVFDQLHGMFPNAKIGFGETGTTNTAKKSEYITRYYSKQINIPNYVGGYFWWYFRQDMVPNTQPLLRTLNSAIGSVPAATTPAPGSTIPTTALPKPQAPATSTVPKPITVSTKPTSPTPTTATAPQPTSMSTAPSTSSTGTTAPMQSIPMTSGYWTTVYNGYGAVSYDATNGIVLAPKASASPSETHSALTLANNMQYRNFKMSITATTLQQLRTGSTPNPWEAFWIFFNYNPTNTGKSTNYFLLKPNGVELGTAVDAIGQTFLYTGGTNAIAIGSPNQYDIEKIGNHVTVSINGVKVTDFTGAIQDVPGSLGLYAEDSKVHIHSVQVTPLP